MTCGMKLACYHLTIATMVTTVKSGDTCMYASMYAGMYDCIEVKK